jgi:hypothetical protein
VTAQAARSSPLLAGLVSYWTMNEAAGATRVDSLGVNSLADAGTVGSAAGLLGNAASFDNNNARGLSAADGASLRISGDKWFGGWVKLTDVAARYNLLNKDDAGTHREYLLELDGANGKLLFGVGFAGGFQQVRWSANAAAGVWTRVDAWYDSTAKTTNICVNAGTPVSLDVSAAGALQSATTQAFEMGKFTAGFVSLNGLLDEWGMWSRIPTASDLALAYNGGAGRTYPF